MFCQNTSAHDIILGMAVVVFCKVAKHIVPQKTNAIALVQFEMGYQGMGYCNATSRRHLVHWRRVLVPSCMGTQDQVGISRHAGSGSLLHSIIIVHIILKSISGIVEVAVAFLLSCCDFGFDFWFVVKKNN